MVPYYVKSEEPIYLNQLASDQSELNILLMLPSISSLLSDIELEACYYWILYCNKL